MKLNLEWVALILAAALVASVWIAATAAIESVDSLGSPTIASLNCAEDEVIDWIGKGQRGCVHIDDLCELGAER
jgi:hypothetical protein